MGYNSWYDLMCSPYMNETTLERMRVFRTARNGLEEHSHNKERRDHVRILSLTWGRTGSSDGHLGC